MIVIVSAAMAVAFIAGFYSGARFVWSRRKPPNLYVSYQPTDSERRQFANYVDDLDTPTVRRRQRIEVVQG